jgi:O-antigen ligase
VGAAGAVVIAVLFLTPLVIAPEMLLYFDVTPKVVVLLLGTALAVLLLDPATISGIIDSRGWGWVFVLALAAQAASVSLSVIFSRDPALSLVGTNWRRFGLLTQLAIVAFTLASTAELVRRPGTLLAVLRAVSLAGVATCAYAIFEYSTMDTASRPSWEAIRIASSLGHPVYFANYIASMVFLSVGHSHIETNRLWRIVGRAAVFLGFIGMALSGTRAAILGVAVGGGFLFPRLRLRPKARLAAGAALALFVLILGLLYLSPDAGYLRNRIAEWMRDYRGGTRLFLWHDTLRMFWAAWPLGHGLETFSTVFPRFESAAFARVYPDSYSESPHNVLIDAALSGGFLGLLALSVLVGLGFFGCRLLRSADSYWASILRAALAASLVANLFACFTVATALYFFLILALIWASCISLEAPALVTRTPSPWLNRLRFVFAALVTIFAVQLVATDASLERIDEDLGQGRFDAAMAGYSKLESLEPMGFSADLWYSRKLLASAQTRGRTAEVLESATAAATRATTHAEDRHNAWYNLALLYAGQGDLLRAEASVRTCIGLAPNWFKPYWLLAEILRSSDRPSDALSAASTAVELNGGRNPEVRQAYQALVRELHLSKER